MILLQAQNAVKEFDGQPLFDPLSFEIKSGDRAALIGLNGTGKSTILKMATGSLPIDKGQMIKGRDVTIGYLSQDVIADVNNTLYQEAETAFAEIKKLLSDLDDIAKQLVEKPDEVKWQNEYATKEALLDKLGGYDYEYRIRTILTNCGFPKTAWDRPITTFSGGEKSRVALAKLLLLNPDLLLLDEPTNHLDIVTIEWLETYLKAYRGAILFVSHDKTFINNLATKIFELENGHLTVYYGNYDRYAAEKHHRYELTLKQYGREQAQMAKLKHFIAFYMPKPRFASRAHDREKKLARLQKIAVEKPRLKKNKVHIDFQGDTREDKKLIRLREVSIGYPDAIKPLLTGVNLEITGQDHLAVMGANGSGKTTLIKTLLGELKPWSGHIDFLTQLRIGYLRQDFMNIRDERTIFVYFKDLFPLLEDQRIYDHLGRFAFSYEDARAKVIDSLSGGEQMRVILAKFCLEDYDLLILDEPTNHLDLFTKAALADALADYQGTLLTISHDRDFVDAIANKILYVKDGQAWFFNGSYADFIAAGGSAKVLPLTAIEKSLKEEKQPDQKSTPDKPAKTSQVSTEKLMEKISKKEAELAQLTALIDEPEYYHDMQKLAELQGKIDDKQDEIHHLYQQLNER